MKAIGCEVIELDCDLDWTFQKYNPNPEDLKMLHEIAKEVKNDADIGFGFDGMVIELELLIMKAKKFFQIKLDY